MQKNFSWSRSGFLAHLMLEESKSLDVLACELKCCDSRFVQSGHFVVGI